MDSAENKLADTLISTFKDHGFLAAPLSVIEKNNVLKMRLRISNESGWLYIIDSLLREELRQKDWTLHICRQYVINGSNLAYVWNFILQAPNQYPLENAVKDICRVIDILDRNQPLSKKVNNPYKTNNKIEEYPLTTNPRKDRNVKNSSGKGVLTIPYAG